MVVEPVKKQERMGGGPFPGGIGSGMRGVEEWCVPTHPTDLQKLIKLQEEMKNNSDEYLRSISRMFSLKIHGC